MKPIRALVADDEPVARDLLRSMLGDHADIEVVAECSDGKRAVQAIRKERPDVAFLDIRMPQLNGLEVAASLGSQDRPHIVFVTALHALDYLLKPFDEQGEVTTIFHGPDRTYMHGPLRHAEGTEKLERLARAVLD